MPEPVIPGPVHVGGVAKPGGKNAPTDSRAELRKLPELTFPLAA